MYHDFANSRPSHLPPLFFSARCKSSFVRVNVFCSYSFVFSYKMNLFVLSRIIFAGPGAGGEEVGGGWDLLLQGMWFSSFL